MAALVIFAAAAGCGRKGPPLPPLQKAPLPVTNLTARRIDGRIELRFTLPVITDDTTQAVIDRVEVYRLLTGGPTAPPTVEMRDPKNIVHTISVRKPVDSTTPPKAGTPPDPRPAPGEPASYTEPVPVGAPVMPAAPATAGVPGKPAAPTTTGAPGRPAMPATAGAPAVPAGPVTAHYLVAAAAGRQRAWISALSVPLGPAPAAPSGLVTTNDETTLTVSWALGPPGQTFRIYEVDAAGGRPEERPLGTAPITTPTFSTPVEFGKTRCFVVRAVQTIDAVVIEGDPAGPTCRTAVDTFPPQAPTGLKAVPDFGAVVLIWDPVNVADLAGYIVLRSDGTSDKLQPLTSTPNVGTTYTDTTSKAGQRYQYAVVAVDNATPPNASQPSVPKEVIGR